MNSLCICCKLATISSFELFLIFSLILGLSVGGVYSSEVGTSMVCVSDVDGVPADVDAIG